MLDEHTRASILKLHEAGNGKRGIARALKISRAAVRKVIAGGSCKVSSLDRAEKAEPYHEEILEQLASCQDNLVRVHEEIESLGVELSYPALTASALRADGREVPVLERDRGPSAEEPTGGSVRVVFFDVASGAVARVVDLPRPQEGTYSADLAYAAGGRSLLVAHARELRLGPVIDKGDGAEALLTALRRQLGEAGGRSAG